MTAIQFHNVTKRYGNVAANEGIDMIVREGDVHAIVGENGAGKSTLMHILCGLVCPDDGEVRVFGDALPPGEPKASLDAGVGLVAQHFSLVPTHTAWENVVLGAEPTSWGILDKRRAIEETADLAESLGVEIPLDTPVGLLPVGIRQAVEIAKALYRKARILVLDEPTSVLSPPETRQLFDLVDRMRESGTTVLLVTHRIQEVMSHADRATVLRRGRVVREFDRTELNTESLIEAIVGNHRNIGSSQARLRNTEIGPPLLSVKGLRIAKPGVPEICDFDLQVNEGEILGIAGVVGNGQNEIVEAINGRIPAEDGSIKLAGKELRNQSVNERRAAGVGTVPEDRQLEGFVPSFSVRDNLILGEHGRFSGIGGLNFSRMNDYARSVSDRFDIRASETTQEVSHLSGGNQQKVILARELSRKPKILLALQPTRGLDVGSTAFVHQQLDEVRNRGGAVLLVSADLEELMGISDRIAVMYRGRKVGELEREDFDEEILGRMMTGAG